VRYSNPVHPAYFADPFVWRSGRDYFAVGTGPEEAAGRPRSRTVFPLLRSHDLVSWRELGRALVRPADAAGDTYWAPEVAHAEGRWFLYYSVGAGDREHQLRVAVSAAPEGPYADAGALTDVAEVPFAIDPHPFRDTDGGWYLFHARDFLDARGAHRAGTALVVHRLETMTRLAREGTTVLRARWDWQRFASGRAMYGGIHDWHTLEGPYVVREGGRYWCLYSGGRWETERYGVDWAVADAVLGPWDDPGGDRGPRVLRTVPGRVIGPGHCSVVRAPDDVTRVIVYHAWDPDLRARTMRIDPLVLAPEGPRSPGPSWVEQELTTGEDPDGTAATPA
jgi:beta-xylosidase